MIPLVLLVVAILPELWEEPRRVLAIPSGVLARAW